MEQNFGDSEKGIRWETSPAIEKGISLETSPAIEKGISLETSPAIEKGISWETSPAIETGFNGEPNDGAVDFPSRLFGKDIMSIVMKRRIGGGAITEEAEPVTKKARIEFSGSRDSSLEQKADFTTDHVKIEPGLKEAENDQSSDFDGENSFKEINLSLDILNGASSSEDYSSFSNETAKDLSAKESQVENTSEVIGGTQQDQVDDCFENTSIKNDNTPVIDVSSEIQKVKCEVGEPQANETTETKNSKITDLDTDLLIEGNKLPIVKEERSVNAKGDNSNKAFDSYLYGQCNIDEYQTKSKTEVSLDIVKKEDNAESHMVEKANVSLNLPSDLDVLASAAEQRPLIDTNINLEETSQDEDSCRSKDKRKSRKQNAPRRIPFAITSMTESGADETTGGYELEEAHRSEKSRKQNKPKRIANEFSDYDEETYYDNDKPSLSDFSTETISGTSGSGLDNGSEEVESRDSADETYYSEQLNEEEDTQRDGSGAEFSYTNIQNLFPYMQGRNLREPGYPVSPFHNEMLATLSRNLYQSPGSTEEGKTSIGSLEDNLDVVRRLREIRFYKYRKISVSEKQEIATYAKIHGVSSAASHFGVSKSAVSMWTRTDFSDMKDDLGKRKRNCMLGNEKFEQLLDRVKSEKVNKFKGLSKQDKFEVSRYAKLVGVREMARCLGIALGTVSGWMRQFPYTLKPGNLDEDSSNLSADINEDSQNGSQDGSLDATTHLENDKGNAQLCDDVDGRKYPSAINRVDESDIERAEEHKLDQEYQDSVKDIGKEESERASHDESTVWDDDTNSKDSSKTVEYEKNEDTDETLQHDEESNASADEIKQSSSNEDKSSGDVQESTDLNDEVDEMIAETFLAPDIDKCFEDIQDQIRGTPLENDEFFESLFRRVLSCRVAKYKTLKPSEKLEVVRYAKRNGVRRIAKLLGLATGTLSGWNTKYQSLLGLTMDGCPEFPTGPEANVSTIDSSFTCQSPSPAPVAEGSGNVYTAGAGLGDSSSVPTTSTTGPTSSSVLDNAEKSEVTAIKLLLKERFPVLLKKIEIARQVKFRNIVPPEKIEIVKCAKLVGIRPTARVLGMPIGTLSGWITKYTNNLHPVYHVENVENAETAPPNVDLTLDSEALRHEQLAKNIAMMNSPASSLMPGFNVPSNILNPAGMGLVSGMPNSFSQNFISGLNTSAFASEVKRETKDDESESVRSSVDSVIHTDKAFDVSRTAEGGIDRIGAGVGFNNPGISVVGSGDFDAETKHFAEQYVRMFREAQMLKFS